MIPKQGHPIVDGKLIDKYWYNALQELAASTLTESRVVELVQQNAPVAQANSVTITPTVGIDVAGNATDGYYIGLRRLIDSGTGDAIWKFTRDDFGRVSGTESATTDDLAEGATNLYHTAERAQDAVGAAIAAGTGDGVTLSYDDAGNKIDATNTDKGSVAVAAHVAASDPHGQYAKEADLADSSGSGMVGFIQSGTGAVARTAQDKAREIVTDADFDTPANAAAAAAGKAAIYNILHGDVGLKYRAIGGVIRQDSSGSGWYFINDSAHAPVGFQPTVTTNGDNTITVTQSFTATKACSLNITPDEGFAKTDLFAGISVGATYSIITFYAPLELRISNLTAAWGNHITTSGGYSIDTTNAATAGTVIVTHPSITHVDSVGSAVTIEKYMPSGTSNGNAEIIVTAQSKTSITLQAMEPISAKVATDGAGAITVTSELITPPTASWNSTTNQLEIAHAKSTAVNGFSVQACTSNYRPVVVSNSDTTLNVEFYDSANVKYTGATAPASVTIVFNRPGTAPGAWSAQNRLVIRRGGRCKVRAQDVWGAGSNWWLYGVAIV